MVFHINKPRPHFLDDFKRDTVLNLRGVHYEVREGIKAVTLTDAISKEQAPGKPPLMYSKTLISWGCQAQASLSLSTGCAASAASGDRRQGMP